MNKKKFTKLLALYLPYLVIGLAATNLGESWRLAEGKELGDKIVSLIDTLPAAFANPLPSLHPLDILVGICCGAGLRLAVYLKSKNAKKYRHGMEYGSARWGTPADIAPFMAPKFEDNIILRHRSIPLTPSAKSTKHQIFLRCHGCLRRLRTIAEKGLPQNFFMREKSQKQFQW